MPHKVALGTISLRRMLDDAYDDSVSSASTLREQLRAKERAAGTLVAGGSLSSISRNNASHSYAPPGRGNVSPSEIADGWRTLIDLYDTVISTATATDDASVKSEMLLRLQPCNEFTKSFTGLHCA